VLRKTVKVYYLIYNIYFWQINRAECLLKPAVKNIVPSMSSSLTLSDVTLLKALMSWPDG
jgi:hypothetical protein